MTPNEILWFAIIAAGLVALIIMLTGRRETGNPVAAALLFCAFSAFTALQLTQEGLIGFYINHTQNLSGLQVWWDLIVCTLIALFFILPRARAQGMNVVLWAIFVVTAASIGLLAMCARLFWLERRASTRTA
ncbi:hypothetical protein [Erythrobacter sp. R86502]|uniref:hypothetical protein n=1 Tax=Erythrobacter sp. R86502 TaxID=3093846 RepID=UPI0036D307D9